MLIGWILCHRWLVRADTLPPWSCYSVDVFATVLYFGLALFRHLWGRCISFACSALRVALLGWRGRECPPPFVLLLLSVCCGCCFDRLPAVSLVVLFFSVSLFLVLCALVLAKSYLAASRFVFVTCFLFNEIRAKVRS